MLRGYTIKFENDTPIKHNVILEEMLHKQIIRETTHESTEFVSPIFIVKKPDGGTRLIPNLKELNEFVKYEHFKMDDIKTIINMVTRNCFMATKDLKDAYYSVAISRQFQKFLKFKWKDKLYCFIVFCIVVSCFPNGLRSCSRKFTKLNKVPITTLHFENVTLNDYIDDFFTKGDTFSICEENIHKTMHLYDKLGFVINFRKSQIVPKQRIRILGFVIDSVKIIIILTEEKKQKLKALVLNLIRINKPTIRYLAKVIGTIISCMPAASLRPLFYRYLENDKVTSLRLNKGNFDAPAKISPEGKQELQWWLKNIDNIEKPIALPSIDFEYFCDSSSYSWGANFNTHKIGGAWDMKEKALHINCQELLAVYYSLRSFKTHFQNKHVKIFSDIQVGVQLINKMGTTKSSICNDIVKNIWLFCVKNKIWITAAHIPGSENVIADYESRKSYKDVEWILNPEIFQNAMKHLQFKPDLDCFASRLNTQLPKYISYKPDPYAYLIDAFSVHWGLNAIYFNLLV